MEGNIMIGRVLENADGISRRIFVNTDNPTCNICLMPIKFGSPVLCCGITKQVRCIKKDCKTASCYIDFNKPEHIDIYGILHKEVKKNETTE